ncbi:MAG: pyridoxal phosphate-dependent aminotransferase [Synergistaceae bacterium]|nr:pyridoxal phosphate-dependent aminotransferase [Synergistaceae bacterium]
MKRFLSTRYSEIKPSLMMKMAEMAKGITDSIDLTLGEPDITTPEVICEELYKAAKNGETHYVPGMGILGLRTAISDYWDRKYGLNYDPDEILVTTGGSHASYLTMQVCLDPGDEVIILEPFFTFYEEQVLQAGGVPIYCMSGAEKGFLPDPKEIESKISKRTKAILINSPCNPTGAVFPYELLMKISQIASKYDLLVVSDELYESFVYEGTHVPFASLPGMKERTITIGGMSKTYAMTGWRIGYAMGSPVYLKAMQVTGVSQTLSVNTMVQRASEFALNNCDDIVKEISTLYGERTKFAYEKFKTLPGIKTAEPKGSFYLFLDVSATGMDGEEFATKALKEARVVTIPGASFGPNCNNYIRIACTVSEEMLEEASRRIRKILV